MLKNTAEMNTAGGSPHPCCLGHTDNNFAAQTTWPVTKGVCGDTEKSERSRPEVLSLKRPV